MKNSREIFDLMQSVASIVQLHGQHDFPSYNVDDDCRTATLCGITVFICNGQVIRLHARDVHIISDLPTGNVANDEKVVSMADYCHCNFLQGSFKELQRWYDRLAEFQTVFRFQQSTQAAQ